MCRIPLRLNVCPRCRSFRRWRAVWKTASPLCGRPTPQGSPYCGERISFSALSCPVFPQRFPVFPVCQIRRSIPSAFSPFPVQIERHILRRPFPQGRIEDIPSVQDVCLKFQFPLCHLFILRIRYDSLIFSNRLSIPHFQKIYQEFRVQTVHDFSVLIPNRCCRARKIFLS